ncbi:Tigger transposable element-derived protein 1, partial [Stegodyphus mimosarum]
MDQGIIKTFKAYYVRHVYISANKALDKGKHDILMAFWKKFSIRHCIEMIKLTWEQVNSSTMNACWQQH